MTIEDVTTVEEPFYEFVYQGSDNIIFQDNVRMSIVLELDDSV